MKKIIVYLLIVLFANFNAYADTDGSNELSQNSNGNVKDCFEGLNRGIFAFNQVLDQVLIEPAA